jgi:hypothetical protein
MTTRSGSRKSRDAAAQTARAVFGTSMADDGVPTSTADGPAAANVGLGDSYNEDVGFIDDYITSTSSSGNDIVAGIASNVGDGTSATAAPALVPLTTRSAPATPAAAQAGHSRGGSSRRLPFRPARKSIFTSRIATSLPPSPPPLVSRTSDPAIAALEPLFAAHLAQEAPAADRRVRFSPESLWDYMCYCFGYGPDEERLGRRARVERRAALAWYTLRSDDADGADGAAAVSVSNKNMSRSGSFRPGGTGTLWIRGRGGAPTRPVVSTDEIVATVMRMHRELGHADARSTTEAVTRAYFGITKHDVQWVVNRCSDCGNGAGRASSSTLSSSSVTSPSKLIGGRAPARKTANAAAASAGAAPGADAAGRTGGASATKRQRASVSDRAGGAGGCQGSHDARIVGMKRKRA